MFFFKNGPSPASISFIFELFQTNNTIFTTIQCEQMSCPSSIRRRKSNPRPLECESPPMTTRPGLPPMRRHMCCRAKKKKNFSVSICQFMERPNYQTNFDIVPRELSVLFFNYINTTAIHLGGYEPSYPSTKEFHCLEVHITTSVEL